MRRMSNVRTRFWVEVGLAAGTAALALLTLINAEWIEWLTGMDPDGGDGSLEWFVVGIFFLASLATGALARREWHRTPVAA